MKVGKIIGFKTSLYFVNSEVVKLHLHLLNNNFSILIAIIQLFVFVIILFPC